MSQSTNKINSYISQESLALKYDSDYKEPINKEYLFLEDSIRKYDHDNLIFLDQDKSKDYDDIKNLLDKNYSVTPLEFQSKYGNEVLNLIKSMNKTIIPAELPKLQFGKQLSDIEFLELLKESISYACYNLSKDKIEKIKTQLLNKKKILENMFGKKQILKDLIENCLLTILISDKKFDQTDNFKILSKTRISTVTPLIKMNFNYNKKNKNIDKEELIETFCSNAYINNFYKSLDEFIPNFTNIVKDETCLKQYIKNHFEKYNIYFAQLPPNMLAITIHTGNVYLKSDYLEEYYNEEDEDSQIIIREKIILNLAHELMNALIKEVEPEMSKNFFLISIRKIKEVNNQIQFQNKFNSGFHPFDANESGNIFDYHFFNGYYHFFRKIKINGN